VNDPQEADCALRFIESPKSDAYSRTEGYLPLSLQYRPYTATKARAKNITADDRTYLGKTNQTKNEADLDLILDTREAMGGKPVIVLSTTANPFVVAEFENTVAGLLLDFQVEKRALFDILSGAAEPSGLLPFQMPADMDTVETQFEDVPRDSPKIDCPTWDT
jgi:beta-glucosidase